MSRLRHVWSFLFEHRKAVAGECATNEGVVQSYFFIIRECGWLAAWESAVDEWRSRKS